MDISSLLEVQVNEGQASPELGSSDSVDTKPKNFIQYRPSEIVTPEESKFYRRMIGTDVAQVRFRRLHCTACDEHIGSAPCDAYNMQEHPMLKTLLCAQCREFYGDGDFEQGEDATDMFCRWCANGGNLYCCSYCCNTFCDKCIKRNFDTEVRERIEEDEKWRCFVCDPKDLYTLRGVCRALLLHVKTVTRILKSNPSMSQKEIESKMEQDDSKCCVGKRNTRRKRSISSSSSLNDEIDQGSSAKKSKVKNGSNKNRKSTIKDHNYSNDKPTQVISNGNTRFLSSTRFLPVEPPPPAQMSDKDDLPAPLLHFEQTMIEGDGQVFPGQPNQPNAKIPDSILNNSAISLNPIPKNLFRGPPGNIINLRPIKLDSVPPGATLHRLARIPTRPNAPMVTIPGRGVPIAANVNQTPKTFLRCKNLTAIPTAALTTANTSAPSVIDIDSDPEELTVVSNDSSKPQQSSNQTLKVINPVALANLEDRTPIMSMDNPRRKIFDDVIYNPIKEVDKILTKIRSKMRGELKKAAGKLADNEAHNARVRLTTINRCIYQTVDELSSFNNTMIQQYRPWKESIITGDPIESITSKIVLKRGERSSKYTPFDMDCESESDSGSETELGDMEDIDVEQLLDFTSKIRHFSEKDVINRSTNTEIETKSQAVQVDEPIETKDYDRSIGYSLLMRTDYDFEKREEIHKPTVIHDHNFGKYEEQFIFYLQHLENRCEDKENEEDAVEKIPLSVVIDEDLARQRKSVDARDKSPKRTGACEKDKESEVVNVVDLEEPVRRRKTPDIIADATAGVEVGEKSPDGTSVDLLCHDDIDVVNVSGEPMDVDQAARLSSSLSSEAPKDCNGDQISVSESDDVAEEDKTGEEMNNKSPENFNNNSDDVEIPPSKVLNDSRGDEEEGNKLTASQEAKHEETVIAVKTLIEENNSVGRYDRWKTNPDEEDECMVLE